ncbi:MAG TPA: hypothetical protein VF458_03685 [Ktedonobacteraceae bacterium]
MSPTTLKRLSGLSLLVGSIIVIAGIVPGFFVNSGPADTLSVATALIRLIGAMLIVLGLPGVSLGGNQRTGVLGLIGSVCTSLFFLMALATEPIFVFVFPYLAVKAPALVSAPPPTSLFIFFMIDGLMLLIGGVLLGISMLRSATSPRWSGLALIIGALVSFAGNFLPDPVSDLGTVIFLIGLIWLTIGLWPKQTVVTEDASVLLGSVRA